MDDKEDRYLWTKDIHASELSTCVRNNLIKSLVDELPLAVELATPRETTRPAQLKQFRELKKRIEKLRESLRSMDAGTRSAINVTRFHLRFDMQAITEAGNQMESGDLGALRFFVEELVLKDPFSNLDAELDSISAAIESNIDIASRGRGRPMHRRRSNVIKIASMCFHYSAPNCPMTAESSSLYYKVVNSYLDEVAEITGDEGIRDDNLVRTLKEMLPA